MTGDTLSPTARNVGSTSTTGDNACYAWIFFGATESSPGSSRTESTIGCISSPMQTLKRGSPNCCTVSVSWTFVEFIDSSVFSSSLPFFSIRAQFMHLVIVFIFLRILLAYYFPHHVSHLIRIPCNCSSTRLVTLEPVNFYATYQ